MYYQAKALILGTGNVDEDDNSGTNDNVHFVQNACANDAVYF